MHRNHQGPSPMRRGMTKAGEATHRVGRLRSSFRRGKRLSPTALFVHLLVTLTLGAGLLMPLADAGQALANPGASPQRARALAQGAVPGAASQVIAFGDFQSQLGCADGDSACQSTSLGSTGGIWTANFPIAPGSYAVQFAVFDQAGNQYTFGQGGQDGGPIDFSVGDAQSGAFFSWNSHTYEVQAEGVDALYTVQTDVGMFVPAPAGGDLEVVIPSEGGTVDVQLLANGAPVADPRQASLDPGWTRLTLDTAGNVVDSEGLTYGTLTVVRLDADGNPAGGGCYRLEDGGQVNQACDSDDGSLDGNTLMTFPEGLEPGGYTLVEAQVPEGLDGVEDQQVDLQPGDNVVQVQQPGVGEDEPTEVPGIDDGDEGDGADPTESLQTPGLPIGDEDEDEGDQVDQGPGNLIVALLDDDGNPIGGACWQLIENGDVVAETCDATDNFPFNGVVGFFGVPGGEYTLRQSETPEGLEPVDDRDIEVEAGQELREEITAALAWLAPTEQPEDGSGDVVVIRQDGDGNPVGGSCFEIVDDTGDEIADEICDEDGDLADDGRTGFFEVPAGTWFVQESRTPDGFDEAEPVQVTVEAGQVAEVVVQGTVTETAEPTEAPTEEPTAEPTAEATEVPAPGNIVVNLTNDGGNPLAGACFQLIQDGDVVTESCDANDQFPNNGRTGFFGMPAGTYTLRQSSDVEGFETLDDEEIEIDPGDDRTLDITIDSIDEPTEAAVPTEEVQPTATPQPTEDAEDPILGDPDPTEEPEPATEPVETETAGPTPSGLGDPGSLIVTLQDAEGQNAGGACFELVNGDDVIDESCDVDDDFPNNGRTGFFGVPSGTFTLRQSAALPGAEAIEPIEVEVVPGQTVEVTVSAPATGDDDEDALDPTETEEPEGRASVRFDVSSIDQSADPICLELNTTGGIGLADPPAACDNGEGDADDEQGVILLEDVPPGEYGLFITAGPSEAIGQEWPLVVVDEGDTAEIELQVDQPEPEPTTVPTEAPEPTAEPTETPEPGEIAVEIVDEEGDEIEEPGTCLTVEGITGSVCDNEQGDADDDLGAVRFEGIPAGVYTISQQAAPGDYAVGNGLSDVVVEEDDRTDVELSLAAATGTIQIVALDSGGFPLGGACWSILAGETEVASQCDDNTNGGAADDGFATFADIPAGDYTLRETEPPPGYVAVDDQPITIGAGENDPVQVVHEAAPVTVQVTTTDAEGEALGGACYRLDDGEELCAGNDGAVTFENVTIGSHQVTQVTAPEGFQVEEPQTVEATPGVEPLVTFVNDSPLTGSISAAITSEGAAVGGTCVGLVDAVTVCDNEAGDANPELGTIQIDGLAPGTYTAALGNYPDAFEDPGTQQVEVVAEETATITFDLVPLPPQTAGLQILVQTDEAAPVAGACVVVSQENAVAYGPTCDNGAGDADPAEGSVLFEDVVAGSYVASLTPESTAAIPGFQRADEQSVTVEAEAENQGVIVVVIEDVPTTGGLELVTRNNASNARVGGACYDLDGPGEPFGVCDNDANDLNALDGVIQLDGIASGDYALVMSTTPEGFAAATDREVTVEPATANSYEVRIDPLPQASTLTVAKEDPNGEALGNSCFALRQGATTVATRCDADEANPNDGSLQFDDLAAGTYMLVETRAPSNGYSLASPISVTIVAGVDKDITVVNYPKAGRLVVTKIDAADASVRLENACFALEGDRGYGPYCDGDDGVTDGRIVFAIVVAGTYTLVETSPPAGYLAADDRDVVIGAGASVNVAVPNEQAPPPEETGGLVVTKVDGDGDSLAGSCFRLFEGNSPVTAQVCDSADGANDGRVRFNDIPVGTWTLHETVVPSQSYQFAALVDVEIRNGQVSEVTVTNELKPGRLQVNKTNEDGDALQGACFDLAEDDAGARCTNASGVATFSNLEPGSYTLTETQAPYGYERAADVEDIQVSPGGTRVVNVVNERTPPPANTGSVQVQKFYCPAGEGGERTQFFGGAQGTQQLARTAGCEKGNAAFTLVADPGEGGPGEFQTGADGQYRVTVPEGLYRLTETDPDLEGNSTVRVRVNRGQMTTVIVINYLAPPEPEAATIDVAKYTCTPSFNGTLYEDFAEGCSASGQLTNNVTVRIEGPVTAKAITGDGGERGVTSFEDLEPGTYTIYEDRPYTTPTDYLFCGANPDLPADQKAVNGTLTVKIEYGDTVTCRFFNIPEQLTEETGTILVRKYVCEVTNPAKGYDWDEECRLSNQNASFSLAQYNAERKDYEEPVIAQANPDGLLRFTSLRPGTYQLREVDGSWCHAESNSVNAAGDVVVTANRLSEVWIYNCVDTQEPPNTGSGDAAPNPPPTVSPEPFGEPHALPGLALPLVAAGAWLGNRNRRHRFDEVDRAA